MIGPLYYTASAGPLLAQVRLALRLARVAGVEPATCYVNPIALTNEPLTRVDGVAVEGRMATSAGYCWVVGSE